MLAASEWVSATLGWPTVGWWLTGFVVAVAVAIVAYEVTGEIQRKRRLARWRAWAARDGGA